VRQANLKTPRENCYPQQPIDEDFNTTIGALGEFLGMDARNFGLP